MGEHRTDIPTAGFVAERLSELDDVLSDRRRFPVGRRVQRCLGKPAAFALAHGIKKFAP
jgi:hypothetical protein